MAERPTLRGRVTEAALRGEPPAAARPTAARMAPRTRLLGLLAALSAVLALAASACGSTTVDDHATELRVLAAASLTEPFTQLGAAYETAHPGTRVVLAFAGSQDLVAQVRQGAPADVLATADAQTMDAVADLVSPPKVFARNHLVIAVAPGNPAGTAGLADLTGDGLKVVLAAPEVPAGNYAAQALAAAHTDLRPASLEASVKGVVTKISLGEADAGIVYVTDVAAADGTIDGIAIPTHENVTVTYPIATLGDGDATTEAAEFIDLVLSPNGQRILREAGFLAPLQR